MPGGPPLDVDGVNADSRAVRPGEAFFALPGTKAHGNAFIEAAVRNGAIAVVSDRPAAAAVPVVVVDDVRSAFAQAAALQFAPMPQVAVAVTGTNGKTSVASFVRQIWAGAGIAAASLGTLGVETASGLIAGSLTTPDPLTLHRTLGALKREGIDHVAIEASSHGLEQGRLAGLGFDAVAFTNLTRDHLDYHGDMESYRNAKLRLFTERLRAGGTAVVNTDDPAHEPFVLAALARGSTLMTVGAGASWFDIGRVVNEGFGQRIEGRLAGEAASFRLPLTGAFQVGNALVAAGLAVATGVAPPDALAALETLRGARGRMELVAEYGGAAIFVDYSHTPAALETALATLRPYARNRLHVVFGAGGDRDRGKRPLMGEVAVRGADLAIVADDNPRTEDAAAIRAQIMAAAPGAREVGDRREAIASAVRALKPGDVLLVAGKGHEDYQEIGTTKHHFSDHEEILAAIGDGP